ncbi:MAG: TatD family hydrolase [bacterium]
MHINKITDTHTHLLESSFNNDREDVLNRAFSNGIDKILEISDTLDKWNDALSFVNQKDDIYVALGEHPHNADLFCGQNRAEEFKKSYLNLQSSKRVVAMGEIGLDFYKDYSQHEKQIIAFEQQLTVWKDGEKALIIHCRDAQKEMLEVLKHFISKSNKKIGVFHCFSGDLEFARRAIEYGFYLGIDGPVTYKKNEKLKNIVKEVGIDNILLETDSPFLAPVPFRGKRNEPSFLWNVAEEIGKICGIGLEKVAEITNYNAYELFKFENN